MFVCSNIHWRLAFAQIQTYQEKEEVYFQQVLSWHPSSSARQWMTDFCFQLTHWPDTGVQVLYSCLVLSQYCPALSNCVQFCPVLCGTVKCFPMMSAFLTPSVTFKLSSDPADWLYTHLTEKLGADICIWPLHYSSLIETFSSVLSGKMQFHQKGHHGTVMRDNGQ